MRLPESGQGWAELFVDAAVPATAAEALAGSHSLALFDAVATPAECTLLCSLATTAARECAARTHDGDGQSVQPGRFRGRIEECLDDESQALCDRVLRHTVARVRASMPTLLPSLGSRLGNLELDKSIVHHPGLVFSPGEPAINIYTSGGLFEPHTDKQSLTILVSLSRARGGGDGGADNTDSADSGGGDHTASIPVPKECSLEYDGGGTGFFCRRPSPHARSSAEPSSQLAHSSRPDTTADMAPPKLVVRPAAGTALVFCGDMRHAGQAVLGGTRESLNCTSHIPVSSTRMLMGPCACCMHVAGGVLVASFSAKVNVPNGASGTPSGWQEHPFLSQVYIPAPKQSLQSQALAAARRARKTPVVPAQVN